MAKTVLRKKNKGERMSTQLIIAWWSKLLGEGIDKWISETEGFKNRRRQISPALTNLQKPFNRGRIAFPTNGTRAIGHP